MALELPPLTSDAGVLARMLIAESRNPNSPGYDAAEVNRGLQAMKATVENRLRTNPAQFNARDARTWTDIVTAPGQWHGFSRGTRGDVVIAPDVARRVEDVVRIANTGAPGRFHAFVSSVLATVRDPARDPFAGLTSVGTPPNAVRVLGGAFGWRTAGSSAPGGRFVAVPATSGGVVAGNQFYTLVAT